MLKTLTFTLILLCWLLSLPTNAKDWGALFEHSQYSNAKISPDGKHLAVAAQINGKTGLYFLDTSTLKSIGHTNFSGKAEVGEYFWVNNERVVISLAIRESNSEKPIYYGELFAINIDGKRGELIYGHRAGEQQTGTRIKKKEAIRGWGEIIDILPNDKRHILISSTPMSNSGERLATVYKLNVYSGLLKEKQGTSPIPHSQFLVDKEGEVRLVVGTDRHNKKQLYVKTDSEWHKINKENLGSSVYPLSISESGEYAYIIDNFQQDLDGIFKLNLKTFKYSHVFTDSAADITDIEMTTDGRTAFAIRVDEGYPAYLILNKKVDEAAIFKNILKTFPNSSVNITSKTDNGDYYIFSVSSDTNSGSIYMLDVKKNKMNFLFKLDPDFNNKDFSPVEPIKYLASDGQEINGYFTAAKNNNADKVPPLVVLVHGGPHGVRDYWSFDPEVQYLAVNGFSVLQINFRGSGGYGQEFEALGYRVWGNRIQQDIQDGYLWLVKQGKAELGNACIMGASFGAYSAVQSVAIFPETYKCAIANAGIYDLELLFDEGDIREQRAGLSYLKAVVGTNKQELKNMSPVNYANKIKAPLLLAHGEDDERAPYEHAEVLREALDEVEGSYEWFVVDKEGHGFYSPDNQRAYMEKVVEFLSKNLNG
ncbi:prolyl oligopeptidase family serine peptidase [Colwelliaceae bacterium MEBiC 14330]